MPKDVDPTMFQEILEVRYVFNRLLAYKSHLLHSATSFFDGILRPNLLDK